MGFLEKAFELSIVVSAIDKFTAPMKKVKDASKTTQKEIDGIKTKMKEMGKTSAEADKLSESMKKIKGSKELTTMLDALKNSKTSFDQFNKGVEDMVTNQKKVADLSKSFDKYKTTAVVGAVATGTGVAMASGIRSAVQEAGNLLITMETIKGATGATTDQMTKLKDTISKVAKDTKYDNQSAAGFGSLLATSGYTPTEVNDLLPTFAKFAQVQEYGKGMDPNESITQAIGLAHGMGKYKPAELETFLNDFNAATFMQPESSSKFGETVKYLMTTGKQMGWSDKDILFASALSNRMGLAGSMGGTNAADMLMGSIPGLVGGLKQTPVYETRKVAATAGHIEKVLGANGLMKETMVGGSKAKTVRELVGFKYPKALQAMMDMGIADKNGKSELFDSGGKIKDLEKFINALYEGTKKMNPMQKQKAFSNIFGVQGSRVANLFASENGQHQLKALQDNAKRVKSTDQMQKDYMKTPAAKLEQAEGTAKNVKLQFTTALAMALLPFLNSLSKILDKINTFGTKHPAIAKVAAGFALSATALLLVAGPITSLIGLIGMLTTGYKLLAAARQAKAIAAMASGVTKVSAVTKVWTAVQAAFNFVMGLSPITWIIIGIVALIGIIVLLVKNWDKVVAMLKKVWTWYQNLGTKVKVIIAIFFPFIGIPLLIISKWGKIKEFFINLWEKIKVMFSKVVDFVKKHVDLLLWIFLPFVNLPIQIIKHWDAIKDWFKKIGGMAKEWGKNLVHGMWEGIKNNGKFLEDKINGFVKNSISDPIKKFFGINSPAKKSKEWGGYIAEGLALGITGRATMVNTASKHMVKQVTTGAETATLGSSAGGGPTIINIYTQPGQSEEQIANLVVKKMGGTTRKKMMNKGLRVNLGSM